jgi:choline dehydrogenase-like flavoprotein
VAEERLTPEERTLEVVCGLLSFVFAGLAVSYLLQGLLWNAEFPFVVNSTAKDGLLAALCALAAADVRRNGWAVTVVIGTHFILIGGLVAMLLFGGPLSVDGSFKDPFDVGLPDAQTLLFIWLGLAVAVTAMLIFLRMRASRARYRLRYLAPHQHRTLMAMAEVLVLGDDEKLTAEEVAANVDEYLHTSPATDKWKTKLALSALSVLPLFSFKPPVTMLSPERRIEVIERRFIRSVAERRTPEFLRRPIQSILFASQQLTFIGYYSDPRSFEQTGYAPFSKRPRYESAMLSVDRNRKPLEVRTPREVDAERVNADVVIVGTGAAAAVIAYKLAQQGREVLMLERGLHLDPSEFTENERSQFNNLYADGGLQMSTDARFQVLQGMCVGGTTVVNNSVSFELPDDVFDRWNDADGLDAGLVKGKLDASFDWLTDWFPVIEQKGIKLNAGGEKLMQGIGALDGDSQIGEYGVVPANIVDCLGSGYCNYGCPYGKKLSALDTTLPRAQREFGHDAVKIYSECTVEKVKPHSSNGSGPAGSTVECKLSDGRRLEVIAKTVVVAAGAIGSSLILQRSGLGGDRVGTGLGFNMGAPMTGEFEERLDAYDGLQISHYLRPPGDEGLIVEAWFNPVGAQSLFMPGWFGEHYENMRRYAYMACAGSVVGTRPNATVKPGFRGRGIKLKYTPHPDDLKRLVAGLELIGKIYLAAGAKRVMPPTFKSMSIDDAADLGTISAAVRDNSDITLHSSHPQGGNAISRNPKKGVVDETFALHGQRGIYVCDASVFPAPITVNPQLTVMALAEYASQTIE